MIHYFQPIISPTPVRFKIALNPSAVANLHPQEGKPSERFCEKNLIDITENRKHLRIKANNLFFDETENHYGK
jgi:hypothetical protein